MFKKFIRNEDGTFAVFTALAMLPLICAVGASVDYARISNARTTLQSITDSAALAANSYSIKTLAQVQATTSTYIVAQAAPNKLLRDVSSTATLSADGKTITLTTTARVKNTLMQIFGYTYTDLSASTTTIRGQDSQLELALVLDNTGSMGDPASNGQSKIQNLITQSTNLINTLTADPLAKVKIGLVPFTQYVNVGTTNRYASWMTVPADYSTTTCDSKGKNCKTTNYGWSGCVTSRPGYNTVDAPSPTYPGLLVDKTKMTVADNPCPYNNPVRPLSTDFAGLKSQIGTMKAAGSTYVPSGLTWGWSILSPGAPYTEGANYDANNRKPRKAIVLMTDGENTSSMASDGKHTGTSQTAADTTSATLCANIKAQKIEVFVVAFMVTNTAAKTMLSACATDNNHYFDAADAASFQTAWDKIAYSLRTPYLAK